MGQEYKDTGLTRDTANIVPVLPLRDVVVYPHMVIPLFVGRDKSILALDSAMQSNKQILLAAQKSADVDDPDIDDMYAIGTLANILQLLKLPDGTVKVLVEGGERARITEFVENDEFFTARLETLTDSIDLAGRETEVLMRSATNLFDQYVKLNKKVPPEVLTSLSSIDDPSRLADTIAAHMSLKLEEKQHVLEMPNVRERLEHLMGLMEGENDILQMEKRIRGRVKRQMEKNQREYYLNEQMKAIQKELGEMDDAPNEIEDLTKKIENAGMTSEAKEKANNELNKLKLMSPMSAEATVVRNYIDTLVGLPWKKRSKIRNDIGAANTVLDEDHYGLDKVKERILEYLAVQQRVRKLKGPILCLVGPPGVGKTSLGQSIARATNRKFTRMALGGVRDEAEIRGHRRTYIGALPGKIINNLSKVKTRNPLFLLDEIDKMAMDFRGDPASALLEVLDPEQNHTFNDHYLEVDFDLSEVMFVATANTLNIPAALLDRMEVIRLSGYTEDEKVNIAERYLVRKQMENNGLKPEELIVRESAIRDIVRYYTREAGVRNLEREIAKICRKVVKEILLKKTKTKVTLTPKRLEDYLSVKRFRYGRADEHDQVGQVTGLAWTEVGGELLRIEAALMPGKGRLSHTGQLGEVMQESIQAAMTVVRSRAESLGLEEEFHQKYDVHIHVPEGATPKDGPSAGVGMCTSLVSALTKIPVKADVAMTGEITLRGEVLPIGGLKEKLLAAHRGGIATVIIPEENERDLVEIPKNIKQNLEIIPVRWIDEVLQIALNDTPQPQKEKESGEAEKPSRKRSQEAGKKAGAPTKH
ncbi:MAG: endopeptidase La [Candidatus Thiodiazotropha lotti]|uniref:Lon protease n=1 Tax=Candidatus Thiodiazotropha endoloripes TaxID=1818881 RepID=A0A1E2UQ57_9GAMM|nr:endopeptidase La [Candidatus Thiodiazotropha endoloripes]MCG7897593.1 endopeptidase La [Candidatus Thiodiazotropha weberae]MCG7992475.1 endopeptidase La [Candidatus Thiodiazotropha lotti]MCG7900825.1 endopeptidase La [Candidatus Thiodiazotropha weberae]MCG7914831.1 endopeptidase La [Candidatus Thiodiazotropha weberae]MCG8001470.1 endopeptidase La [Candidatus Thiodiazotropha lotti]